MASPDEFGDWADWDAALDGQAFQKRMKTEMRAAYTRLGKYARSLIRRRITLARRYEENSLVTVLFKGHETPVRDKGRLYGALEFEVVEGPGGEWSLQMFVKGSPVTKSGRTVAEIVHDGAVIQVTPAMRAALFARLAKMGKADQLGPTGPAKAYWVIPPRPFIREPLESDVYRKRVELEVTRATGAALTGTRTPDPPDA